MLFKWYIQEHQMIGEKVVPLGKEHFFQSIGHDYAEGLIKARKQAQASDLQRPTIRPA